MAEAAKRTQTVKRSALTTYINKINTALSAETCPTLKTLERLLLEANKRVTELVESYTTVLITSDLEDEDLDNLSQSQETWLEPKHQVLEILQERIETLNPVPNWQTLPNIAPDAGNQATANGGTGPTYSTAKILKLKLSIFDGTDTDLFPDWENEIRTHVGNRPEYDAATKLGLLRQYTEKTPNDMIAGLPLTQLGYETAFDLLVKRYGRPSRIAYRHVKALLGLEALRSSKGQTHVTGLYNMYTSITKHLRGLANIKENMRVEDILLPLIISKFPVHMQHELSKNYPNLDVVDLQELLKFIEGEVQRYEFISDFTTSDSTNATGDKPAAAPNPAGGSVTTLQVNADNSAPGSAPQHGGNSSGKRNKCEYCKHPNHATRSCPRFWTADKARRLEMVKKAGLCTRCLKRGHPVTSCSASCRSCGGQHANSLCFSSASHRTHPNPNNSQQGVPYQASWSGQAAAAGFTMPPAAAGQQQRSTYIPPPQSNQYLPRPASAGAAATAPPPHLGYTLPAHTNTLHNSSGYNNDQMFSSYPQVQQSQGFRRVTTDARPPDNGRTQLFPH